MDSGQLRKFHEIRGEEIRSRINEFRAPKTDNEIFSELCFCLLTPQSRAKTCWKAVASLKDKGLLHHGTETDILPYISDVRFCNNKSRYIVAARKTFEKIKHKVRNEKDPEALRFWLVNTVKGYGYKEASHFLRNIGFLDFAILDRHIMSNLVNFGVIDKIPTLTPKRYLETEEKMKSFAKKINIPLHELDLLLWSMQTGEVFK